MIELIQVSIENYSRLKQRETWANSHLYWNDQRYENNVLQGYLYPATHARVKGNKPNKIKEK